MNMKVVIITLAMFLLTLPVGAFAQTPPDLEVSNPQLNWNVNQKFKVTYSGVSTTSERSPFSVDPVQEISATFRNTGTKAIKRVLWEFINYKDETQTKISRLYTVKSKTEILPGESVRLNKIGVFWGGWASKAKVFRIEYADGTVWEGTRTKN